MQSYFVGERAVGPESSSLAARIHLPVKQRLLGGVLFLVLALLVGFVGRVQAAPNIEPGVDHAVPKVVPPPTELNFSSSPTATEFLHTGLFDEPLAPVATADSVENRDLAKALLAYRDAVKATGGPDAVEPLLDFLAKHSDSPWKPALQLNLGIVYRQTGHFSKALAIWQEGWKEAQTLTDPQGRAYANAIVARLSQIEAYLGRKELLQPLLDSIQGRSVGGTAAQLLTNSHTGLYDMLYHPEDSFRCGPLALTRILKYSDAKASPAALHVLENAHSTPNGLSLAAVQKIAAKAGLHYRMAYREPGAAVILPAVAHWKVGHYAAIVDRNRGRYVVQDTTFGEDVRVSPQTLDEEASGYFLVPMGALPDGWRSVSAAEGAKIWGRGNTGNNVDGGATGVCPTCSDPSPTDSSDDSTGGSQPPLTKPDVELVVVGLQLHDFPVGYTPPLGPPVKIGLYYSHRDTQQPATFSYTNFGPKWTFTWLSYITDTVNSNGQAVLYRRGGGNEPFTFQHTNGTIAYPGPFSQATLSRSIAPIGGESLGFVVTYPDGSIEQFEQASGDKFFLTAVIDPAGNTVSLTYDSQTRITAITDAIGQVTTVSYGLSGNPLLVTQITDPFGRSASFAYNASGQLASITDILGITSSYTYGQGTDPDFVNTLTTPYGSTTFTYGDSSTNSSLGSTRFLKTVDPLNRTSYVEFDQGVDAGDSSGGAMINPALIPTGMNTCNQFLYYRNTFIFDANQYQRATQGGTLNYSLARVIHWLHSSDETSTSRFIESEKQPLENRVWYNYPAQGTGSCDSIFATVSSTGVVTNGASSLPSAIGRVLDNGATQLQTFQYNSLGKVTQATDPVGRQMSYTYASNGIDLLTASNTTGGTQQLLESRTYNSQHLPLTITGANGKTAQFQYNSDGQPTRYTDRLGHATSFSYDTDGRLASATGPIGTSKYSFAYDSVNRVVAATDPAGATVRFTYDAADRVTVAKFPDGTTNAFAYTLLDLTSSTDRLRQTTYYRHDADRELTGTTDPLGNTRQFGYNSAGQLASFTDENSHTTSYTLDDESRTTVKMYADGTSIAIAYAGALSTVGSVTDALGQLTTYSYNADNTVATIGYHSNQPTAAVSFSWDPAYRRIVRMVDGTGTATYSYYPVSSPATLGANQLQSVTSPVAGTSTSDNMVYSYDALDRVVGLMVNSVPQSFGFDALGRVTSIGNALDTFAYSYSDGTRRVSAINSSAGPAAAMTYFGPTGDELLQQLNVATNGGGTSLSQFGYAYNANDNVTGTTISVPGAQATSYAYDAENRLVSGLFSGTTPQYSYGYDAASNVTSLTANGSQQTYSYTSTNTITAATYDANGSPTALGGGVYTWDGANRVAAFSNSTNNAGSTFTYDGLGRLVRIVDSNGGVVTADHSYTWCGAVRCLAHDNTQSGSPVSAQYFFQGVITGGTSYYYVSDRSGSVTQLINGDGSVAAQYAYDPYGNQTVVNGAASDTGYAGYLSHAASGLDFAMYRAYDPAHARWLNHDPIGEVGGFNLYAYVGGQPVSESDPLGLAPCPINLDQLVKNARQGTIDPKSGQQRTHGGGNCANTVRNDIVNAGGPRLPPLGTGGTPAPGNWGVALVGTGCYQQVADPSNYSPQPGDIAITPGNGTGHISIYDGTNWDADIATPNPVPARGGAYTGAQATIYQYTGTRL